MFRAFRIDPIEQMKNALSDPATALENEELIPKALEAGLIEERGGWYDFGQYRDDGLKVQGIEDARRALATDPDLREAIWVDLADSEHPATIKGAPLTAHDLERIETNIRETPRGAVEIEEDGRVYDPLEVVELVIQGQIDPRAIPTHLDRWVAHTDVIPGVPGWLEDILYEALERLLEELVIDRIRRRVRGG